MLMRFAAETARREPFTWVRESGSDEGNPGLF
ncbi:hypothetical protein SAMN05421772_108106 [Paracoccus saliphilus]|uniref:Uncharacterized protein n=1 Tax=Paracoccus saliphilus TaxID=405559 RepID=A0AA45W560_9RHOB|nr:hypothetical protein SAMN05421772_108106 [Paracoccus saliphilus]